VAGLHRDVVGAGRWLIKGILSFARANDPRNANQGATNFLTLYRSAPPAERAKLKVMWEEAGLGPLPG
jgi:hypothetical protein